MKTFSITVFKNYILMKMTYNDYKNDNYFKLPKHR